MKAAKSQNLDNSRKRSSSVWWTHFVMFRSVVRGRTALLRTRAVQESYGGYRQFVVTPKCFYAEQKDQVTPPSQETLSQDTPPSQETPPVEDSEKEKEQPIGEENPQEEEEEEVEEEEEDDDKDYQEINPHSIASGDLFYEATLNSGAKAVRWWINLFLLPLRQATGQENVSWELCAHHDSQSFHWHVRRRIHPSDCTCVLLNCT